MTENLGSILIGLAAILSIGVVYAIARRIFLGALVPLEVKELLEAQNKHINLLGQQNEALNNERKQEKTQLLQMVKDATEANFAIHSFLDRYEALGGFANNPTVRRRGENPKSEESKT